MHRKQSEERLRTLVREWFPEAHLQKWRDVMYCPHRGRQNPPTPAGSLRQNIRRKGEGLILPSRAGATPTPFCTPQRVLAPRLSLPSGVVRPQRLSGERHGSRRPRNPNEEFFRERATWPLWPFTEDGKLCMEVSYGNL
ncbi:hypothetical protein QYE77_08970 [Thermanaerothrix sp. 4228-RoL]|uniref:Uncharacterized protein n=1 Tax=Thermanaerothrix solaris TaxID=3058434 RepID=A0ABU3NQR4_9CHLR|nr:hypothetical protein [Thermanaerothrix sp. 4228-RoL]MDT8898397.1 hypothetical protein [Thermanaerothrix sp. 4228-RoL]